MPISVVILAAGKGKRMRSDLPKVLHTLAGRPLLSHVAGTAARLGAEQIYVVYGHGGEQVPSQLPSLGVNWVEQSERLGTGHAVLQAMPAIPDEHTVMVLYGDVPLITPQTLQRLLDCAGADSVGLLTARVGDPAGYGRIVRSGNDAVERIVEEKDAGDEVRSINEINTGFVAVGAGRLRGWLQRVGNNNSQGEYYLTDIIALAAQDGVAVNTASPAVEEEILGINDRQQLARLERYFQMKQAEQLMQQGVTLRDPARFDVRGDVSAGRDVVIDVNVILEGRVVIGDNVTIGPNVLLRDVEIGDGVEILANCVIEEAVIGRACRIGPFARIRPETRLADEVHIGNFVEVKKSEVGQGTKINHLSYIGDSGIGRMTNIGAGTITCNYDGANKYRTVIGDDVFVGSDTQLIAPVTIGDRATIGAGSTISKDAPADRLTLCRSRDQVTIEAWQRPRKKGK